MSKTVRILASTAALVALVAGCSHEVPLPIPTAATPLPSPTSSLTTSPPDESVNLIQVMDGEIYPRHMTISECKEVVVMNEMDVEVTVASHIDLPDAPVSLVVPPHKTGVFNAPSSKGMQIAACYIDPATGERTKTYPSVDFMVTNDFGRTCDQFGND